MRHILSLQQLPAVMDVLLIQNCIYQDPFSSGSKPLKDQKLSHLLREDRRGCDGIRADKMDDESRWRATSHSTHLHGSFSFSQYNKEAGVLRPYNPHPPQRFTDLSLWVRNTDAHPYMQNRNRVCYSDSAESSLLHS